MPTWRFSHGEHSLFGHECALMRRLYGFQAGQKRRMKRVS